MSEQNFFKEARWPSVNHKGDPTGNGFVLPKRVGMLASVRIDVDATNVTDIMLEDASGFDVLAGAGEGTHDGKVVFGLGTIDGVVVDSPLTVKAASITGGNEEIEVTVHFSAR